MWGGPAFSQDERMLDETSCSFRVFVSILALRMTTWERLLRKGEGVVYVAAVNRSAQSAGPSLS